MRRYSRERVLQKFDQPADYPRDPRPRQIQTATKTASGTNSANWIFRPSSSRLSASSGSRKSPQPQSVTATVHVLLSLSPHREEPYTKFGKYHINSSCVQSPTWAICTRRAGKLCKARSLLYRSQILQVNTHVKLSTRSTQCT